MGTIQKKCLASIGAVFSGVMFVIQPLLMHKFKVYARGEIRLRRPYSPWLILRVVDSPPLKYRDPVFIKDIGGERGEWVKGYYYLEEHNATNLHHDFTIIVNGKAYRMARSAVHGTSPKLGYLGVFPNIREKTGWILQPEHFLDEVPNPPVIEKGYGAGTTKILKEGHCYVMISESNNMHAIFEDIDGVYTFVETKDRQVLMMRKHYEGSWIGKHSMREAENVKPYIDDSNYAFFVKKDGAAIEWRVVKASDGKKYLHVHSYRPNARIEKETGIRTQIDHTFRLHLTDKPLPDNTPLSAGRGELWCSGSNGRLRVARIMNSSHYKARSYPYRPYLYMHDVVEYNGKNVETLPYKDKVEIMQELHDLDHRLKIPAYAKSAKGKSALWDKTHNQWKTGKEAVDGIIAWRMDEPDSKGVKIKFTHDKEHWHAATIVDVVPQQGEHSDKYAYPILENKYGVRFQASGKGLTNSRKAELMSKPEKYIGMEVRYSADSHFDDTTGKPFQPTIKEWNTIPNDVLKGFDPDFTYCEMEKLGVLESQYKHNDPNYSNYFGVKASQDTWPNEWKDDTAPEGWYQWYKGYCSGIRTSDDVRQINRWKSYKARHMAQLVKADPTMKDLSIQPKRRQALLNWGIDSGVKPSDKKMVKQECNVNVEMWEAI